MMVREFSVEITADDRQAIERALVAAGAPEGSADVGTGRRTYLFGEDALVAAADGDFERFLWSVFDRVDERDGLITLASGTQFVFCLPVAKLQDPEIRRAVRDFVMDRLAQRA